MKTNNTFDRRKSRTRHKLKQVNTGRVRLSVYRSNANIYAQIIDDTQSKTLAFASTIDKDFKGKNLKANIDLWQLLSGAILIEEVDLNTAKLNLKVLPDSTWNFQFIINC